jgi:hypothetical protein
LSAAEINQCCPAASSGSCKRPANLGVQRRKLVRR